MAKRKAKEFWSEENETLLLNFLMLNGWSVADLEDLISVVRRGYRRVSTVEQIGEEGLLVRPLKKVMVQQGWTFEKLVKVFNRLSKEHFRQPNEAPPQGRRNG